MRGNDPAKAFGGGANDKLAARGALGAAFAALVAAGQIRVESEFRVIASRPPTALASASAPATAVAAVRSIVDELVVATGFRPDLDFLRELRIRSIRRSNARWRWRR